MELFVGKITTKIKISACQRISIKTCMNYDHSTNFGLFKFQSGYRKIIKAQTEIMCFIPCNYMTKHVACAYSYGNMMLNKSTKHSLILKRHKHDAFTHNVHNNMEPDA